MISQKQKFRNNVLGNKIFQELICFLFDKLFLLNSLYWSFGLTKSRRCLELYLAKWVSGTFSLSVLCVVKSWKIFGPFAVALISHLDLIGIGENMKNTCSKSLGCCFKVFLLIFVIIWSLKRSKKRKEWLSLLSPSAELTHNTPGVDPRLLTDAEL